MKSSDKFTNPTNNNKSKGVDHKKKETLKKLNNLKLLTINVRGIKSKLKSLKSALQSHGTDIAGITETLLRPGESINIEGPLERASGSMGITFCGK